MPADAVAGPGSARPASSRAVPVAVIRGGVIVSIVDATAEEAHSAVRLLVELPRESSNDLDVEAIQAAMRAIRGTAHHPVAASKDPS